MTPDLMEQVKAIARVRACTTNRDVLDICDGYSRLLSSQPVTSPIPVPVTSSACPVCEAKKVADRAKAAKWRAKKVRA